MDVCSKSWWRVRYNSLPYVLGITRVDNTTKLVQVESMNTIDLSNSNSELFIEYHRNGSKILNYAEEHITVEK